MGRAKKCVSNMLTFSSVETWGRTLGIRACIARARYSLSNSSPGCGECFLALLKGAAKVAAGGLLALFKRKKCTFLRFLKALKWGDGRPSAEKCTFFALFKSAAPGFGSAVRCFFWGKNSVFAGF